MSGPESQPARKPIRSGLFVEADGPPRLLASRCRETGAVFWPRERINPDTHKGGTLEDVEIDGNGTIVSYTVVARGLPGFASPYALATIALDDGPSLIAQLEDWKEVDLHTGTRVTLAIGTIKTERDGTAIVGPKFRPVAAS